MIRIIILAVVAYLAMVMWSNLKATPPEQRRKLLFRYSLLLIAGVAVVLALTGRLHWIGAVFAVLLPLVQKLAVIAYRFLPVVLPWLQKKLRDAQLKSASVVISINPGTGQIDGEILKGEFAGKKLSQLDQEQLQSFYQQCCQQDPEAARLLAAYLQRRFNQQYQQQAEPAHNDMSEQEARLILGIEGSYSKEDVTQAHRRLIQRLHPDRGGNDYLAAKINRAKELLLSCLS